MNHNSSIRRLYRSRTDRQLTGVAGGMALYLNLDVSIVRILWVLAVITSGPVAVVAYLLMAIIVPQEPELTERAFNDLAMI